jgi:hypothetical protein
MRLYNKDWLACHLKDTTSPLSPSPDPNEAEQIDRLIIVAFVIALLLTVVVL